MPNPDVKVAVGDVVHVRVKVDTVSSGREPRILVRRKPGQTGWWLNTEEIVHVEPRPIQVGDEVRWHGTAAEVRALENGVVWLRFNDGEYASAHASDMRRIPNTCGGAGNV